jgi:hypothetical protein
MHDIAMRIIRWLALSCDSALQIQTYESTLYHQSRAHTLLSRANFAAYNCTESAQDCFPPLSKLSAHFTINEEYNKHATDANV